MSNCWNSYESLWRPNDLESGIISWGQCSSTRLWFKGWNRGPLFWTGWSTPLFSCFGSIWHENRYDWKTVLPYDNIISAVDILTNKFKTSSLMASKHRSIDGRSGYTEKGITLKNTPHLVRFYEIIFPSLWNFQLTPLHTGIETIVQPPASVSPPNPFRCFSSLHSSCKSHMHRNQPSCVTSHKIDIQSMQRYRWSTGK